MYVHCVLLRKLSVKKVSALRAILTFKSQRKIEEEQTFEMCLNYASQSFEAGSSKIRTLSVSNIGMKLQRMRREQKTIDITLTLKKVAPIFALHSL